jgi:DNA polymerase III subunit alpha
MGFVHLHAHTHSSLLDGAMTEEALVKRAAELGQGAVAITDHGVLFGSVKFIDAAREHGVKPIIGLEAYVATQGNMREPAQGAGDNYHLTMLAADATGYQNLVHLTSAAHLEGFSYKARIDRDILERHSAGLIVLSGCFGGELPQLLMEDRDAAYALAEWYIRVFGERFFVEIQVHGGTGGIDHVRQNDKETGEILWTETDLNMALVELADTMGIGIVATNDAHYLGEEDGLAQDAMLCLQTGGYFNKEDRFAFPGAKEGHYPFYVKTEEEMLAVHDARWWETACINTQHIADLVADEVFETNTMRRARGEQDRYIVPAYTIPDALRREFDLWRDTGVIRPKAWGCRCG